MTEKYFIYPLRMLLSVLLLLILILPAYLFEKFLNCVGVSPVTILNWR